ncbi:MAG: type II toxin-antitoxin system PemK/MazF family toxin [Candidatus Eremiobacterota bacterium]
MRWGIYKASLDPVCDSEQAGVRPVIVISADEYNKNMPLVTVIPVTSRKVNRKIYSNEVLLAEGQGGLPVESIALVHQIRTISSSRLDKKYGIIEDRNIKKQIQFALIKHLDLMEDFLDYA